MQVIDHEITATQHGASSYYRSIFSRLYSNSQVEYRFIPNPYPLNIH